MNPKKLIIPLLVVLLFSISCLDHKREAVKSTTDQKENIDSEKVAILEVLNNETKAAFSRDYAAWKDNWIHESYATKTYMNFSEGSMNETLGWKEIDDFVRTYIEQHPEPAPLPSLINDLNLRLYENGAWITYEQNDTERGLKRETRLMEKVNGQWKIAGMQTTIYGFKNKD